MKLVPSFFRLAEAEFCERCTSVCDSVAAIECAREKALVQALTYGPLFR